MSDFFLEFCDPMEGNKTSGMPIPRCAPRMVGHFPDTLQMDTNQQEMGREMGRDLSGLSGLSRDLGFSRDLSRDLMSRDLSGPSLMYHDSGLSPVGQNSGPNSPCLWPQSMDLDVDIKMEPLDDLILDDLLPSSQFSQVDTVLLDDVSLDDLLMPQHYTTGSSFEHNEAVNETTRSPLQSPLFAVPPDEVLGSISRSYPGPSAPKYASEASQCPKYPSEAERSSGANEASEASQSSQLTQQIFGCQVTGGAEQSETRTGFTTRAFGAEMRPIKAESDSLYSLLASSFPPQGGGWRDPLLTSSSLPRALGSIEENPGTTAGTISGSNAGSSAGTISGNAAIFGHDNLISSEHSSLIGDNVKGYNVTTIGDGNQTVSSDQQMGYNYGVQGTSALQELLLRSPSVPLSPQAALSPIQDSQEPPLGVSVPRPNSISAANPLLSARLSSSAPTRNFSLEQAWQRREPRQHLLSTGSLAEELGGSTSSLSTGGILSPSGHDLSIDEGIDSDDDSDNEHYDSESDNDSIVSEDMGSLSGSLGKKERYFWQYNVQAKGPKGHRVTINQQQRDPYSLPSVMDPVFSPLCSIQGIKHSGKARRGDGNDLTPNPRKLVSIGRELEKLNKTINDMTPVSELPFNVRPKSRKEKNKLASRACRLKKKAQHEANKIKLYGLEQEHKGMMSIIDEARKAIVTKMEARGTGAPTPPNVTLGMAPLAQAQQKAMSPAVSQAAHLAANLDKVCKLKTKHRIAGHTTDFVNKVIENCQNGNSTGGLEELTKIFHSTTLTSIPPGEGGFSPH